MVSVTVISGGMLLCGAFALGAEVKPASDDADGKAVKPAQTFSADSVPIPNSSFESPLNENKPLSSDNWGQYFNRSENGKILREKGKNPDGNYCIVVQGAGDYNGVIYGKKLFVGKKYRMTVQYRTEQVTGRAEISAKSKFDGKWIERTATLVPSKEWKEGVLEFVVPGATGPEEEQDMIFQLSARGQAEGESVRFDAVAMKVIPNVEEPAKTEPAQKAEK
jgi:hypothetical protein